MVPDCQPWKLAVPTWMVTVLGDGTVNLSRLPNDAAPCELGRAPGTGKSGLGPAALRGPLALNYLTK